MSPKDFIFSFFLVVIAALVIAFLFTYSEVTKYYSESVPGRFDNVGQDEKPAVKSTAVTDGPKADSQPASDVETAADNYNYLPGSYPVPHSETGKLKNIAVGATAIIITNDDGIDRRAAISKDTEIFRNGARADLSSIKETDRILIQGRKRSEAGDEFIADAIYATQIEASTPVAPAEPPSK